MLCWNTGTTHEELPRAMPRVLCPWNDMLCRRTEQTPLTCPSLYHAKPVGKGILEASLVSKQLFSLSLHRRDAERRVKGEGERAACKELLLSVCTSTLWGCTGSTHKGGCHCQPGCQWATSWPGSSGFSLAASLFPLFP